MATTRERVAGNPKASNNIHLFIDMEWHWSPYQKTTLNNHMLVEVFVLAHPMKCIRGSLLLMHRFVTISITVQDGLVMCQPIYLMYRNKLRGYDNKEYKIRVWNNFNVCYNGVNQWRPGEGLYSISWVNVVSDLGWVKLPPNLMASVSLIF